jgi:hypothetical protein
MEREPIPNIDFSLVVGPKRGSVPEGYDYDEAFWSPDKRHVVLGYSITEARMGTYVGRFLWASVRNGQIAILGNPSEVFVSCWHSPWCAWLDEQAFAVKTCLYRALDLRSPTAIIHLQNGFAVLPFTSNSALSRAPSLGLTSNYQPFSDRAFSDAVRSA